MIMPVRFTAQFLTSVHKGRRISQLGDTNSSINKINTVKLVILHDPILMKRFVIMFGVCVYEMSQYLLSGA